MATINVLLRAKAQDKGVHAWLTKATQLADGLAASLDRAGSSMGALGRGASGSLAAAGRGGGARGGGRSGGGGTDSSTSFDKALREATRTRERAWQRESRDAERTVSAIAQAGQRRAKASQRAAKNLEELSDEQLREREIQREINSRRTRAARASAREGLGADPSKPGRAPMGPFGKLEFAENLAVAGAEFEQFGNKIEGGIRSSFDAFRDYEKKVAEIGTITDAVTLDQIDAIAKEAVGTFGGEPIKQAEALQKVMSMGAATAADAQAQLMAANKLGIAGSANVADSVSAISKSVANFQGTSAQEAADAIFAVTQASSAEVGDLAQALPRVAAGAAMAGLTLQETVGTIGQLSNKLPDANQAVTGMIQMLSNIQKPTKRAREEADRLGIDFSTAGIEAAGGWEQFLLKLRSAEGYDQDTLAKLFDSSEARIAVAAIVDDMEGLNKNLEAQKKAAGGTEKAYAKMTDTAAHKAALLEGQWESLKIQAGEQLIPALLGIAEAVGPIIKSASEWIANNSNTAASLAKLAVVVAVGSKTIGGLVSAYSMWQTISGITQLGNMKLGKTTESLASSIDKSSKSIGMSAKAMGGLRSVVGALPAIFAGATVAISAFNLVLDQAQKPLAKYEEAIAGIEEQQKSIAFKRDATQQEQAKFEQQRAEKLASLQDQLKGARGNDRRSIKEQIAEVEGAQLGPVTKSEEELLLERRNRLIKTVNASRVAAREARGGAAADTFLGGDALGGIGQAFGGVLNRATGVADELGRQQQQAEIDLAAFDQQYGSRLNLGEQTFTTEATSTGFTGDTGTLAMLAKLVEATQMVANNTKTTTGPSMEAGPIA